MAAIQSRPTARSPLAVGTPSDEWYQAQARKLVEGLPKPAPKPKPKAPPTPPKPTPAKPPSDRRYLDNKGGRGPSPGLLEALRLLEESQSRRKP